MSSTRRPRAGQLDDTKGEVEDADLFDRADVEHPPIAAGWSKSLDQRVDDVEDVTEAPGLQAVAEDRERFTGTA